MKMQNALGESEKGYRSIFENSRDGIYQSTLDGKYIDANPALVKMLGYSSKEELFQKIFKKISMLLRKTGQIQTAEISRLKQDLKRKTGK